MASPESSSQQFSLHWDKCQENLLTSFEKLLNSEHFVDVSLAVESEVIKCHKVVLSACSAYFEKILLDNPCQHPVVIMRGMTYWEVSSLVNFMYKGEVSVEEERLDMLLKAAEALQIRGLAVTGGTGEKDPLSINETITKSDSEIRPKKVYSKSKNKKSKPNPEMLNDEVEIKLWPDNSLNELGLLPKDNKNDSCMSVSSLDIVRPSGSLQKDETSETELEKKTEEPFSTSSLPQKNIMIKEEVHMEFVNTDDVENSLDYENFEDDDVSLDGNFMQPLTSEPGPSHHFLNVDTTSKGKHLAEDCKETVLEVLSQHTQDDEFLNPSVAENLNYVFNRDKFYSGIKEEESTSTERKFLILENRNSGKAVNITMPSSSADAERTVSSNDDGEENPKPSKYTKRIRSKDFCFYCKSLVLDFARHIFRHHSDETEVQEAFSKPCNSKERKVLITALRKKGNYILNVSEGCKRPVRQHYGTTHLPCVHCLGFYSKKQLRRHRKRCGKVPVTIDPGKSNSVKVVRKRKSVPNDPSERSLVKVSRKRTLVPWTFHQKQTVIDYFKDHISVGRPAKRYECEKLIEMYPDLYENKSWLKIKVFVQNQYRKLNKTVDPSGK